MKRRVKNWMIINRNGFENATELAEFAAHEFGHSEWLDDSDHWIWELAIDFPWI